MGVDRKGTCAAMYFTTCTVVESDVARFLCRMAVFLSGRWLGKPPNGLTEWPQIAMVCCIPQVWLISVSYVAHTCLVWLISRAWYGMAGSSCLIAKEQPGSKYHPTDWNAISNTYHAVQTRLYVEALLTNAHQNPTPKQSPPRRRSSHRNLLQSRSQEASQLDRPKYSTQLNPTQHNTQPPAHLLRPSHTDAPILYTYICMHTSSPSHVRRETTIATPPPQHKKSHKPLPIATEETDRQTDRHKHTVDHISAPPRPHSRIFASKLSLFSLRLRFRLRSKIKNN